MRCATRTRWPTARRWPAWSAPSGRVGDPVIVDGPALSDHPKLTALRGDDVALTFVRGFDDPAVHVISPASSEIWRSTILGGTLEIDLRVVDQDDGV